ncbi:MAG: ParB/RepB/Spo0J family partition protein, partial [Planctomycetales bacterium]|nr:ParB/RepB/Spo0J family partition protein [Planctomycetales bacterium]
KRPRPKLVSTKTLKQAIPKDDAEYTLVPVVRIIAEKQHRLQFDEQEIAELARSIETHGIIQPVVVRWDEVQGRFVIVAGERRFRAAKLANLSEIPCRVMQLTDSEVAEIQLVENLGRKDLNAIELAKAFRDVISRTGQTAKGMAKRLGIGATTVTRTLRLLRLPEDVQKLVVAGRLSARQAREIARVSDEISQRAFVSRAIDDSLSGREVEEMVKAYLGQKKKPDAKPRKPTARGRNTKGFTFVSEYGTIQFTSGEKFSNHHVAAALKEALEEVQHRIDNGVID